MSGLSSTRPSPERVHNILHMKRRNLGVTRGIERPEQGGQDLHRFGAFLAAASGDCQIGFGDRGAQPGVLGKRKILDDDPAYVAKHPGQR